MGWGGFVAPPHIPNIFYLPLENSARKYYNPFIKRIDQDE